MKTIAIIQGRMSSQRLPGKILQQLQGKPVIEWTLRTCQSVPGVDETILATSNDSSDDPVADWADSTGIRCVRGDLDNVIGRFVAACEEVPSDVFFRVNADSPLINRSLFVRALDAHLAEEIDLVTNIMPRTYPPGLSVEALRTESFLQLAQSPDLTASDREHVTAYFYRNADRFRIRNLEGDHDISSAHLAIDTPEDFERVQQLLGVLGDDPGGVDLARLPEIVDHLTA